jgi:hypothetical protein
MLASIFMLAMILGPNCRSILIVNQNAQAV